MPVSYTHLDEPMGRILWSRVLRLLWLWSLLLAQPHVGLAQSLALRLLCRLVWSLVRPLVRSMAVSYTHLIPQYWWFRHHRFRTYQAWEGRPDMIPFCCAFILRWRNHSLWKHSRPSHNTKGRTSHHTSRSNHNTMDRTKGRTKDPVSYTHLPFTISFTRSSIFLQGCPRFTVLTKMRCPVSLYL